MKKPTYDDVNGDISKFLPLINAYVEHLEETMETVHWNACNQTIKACQEKWHTNSEVPLDWPPYPLINKVKRV